MVTAPVQKSAINDAGIAFTGHTEFLAERTHSKVVMMLVGLMSFELLRSMWGYQAPSKSGMLVRFFAQQFGDLPKD